MSAVLSSSEKALAGGVVMAAMYAGLILVLGDRLTPAYWAKRNEARRLLVEQRNEQRALISQKEDLIRSYDGLRDMMPVFTTDNGVDTYWRDVISEIANRHGVSISCNPDNVENTRGACEMPFSGTWSASLDSLVRFLYDLRATGAMLDIRKIVINPDSKNPGRLHGTFTLNCAFMLGEREYIPSPEKTSSSPAAPAAGDSPADQETTR